LLDSEQLQNFINATWDNSIIPALSEYIKIPNKSPAFDSDWEKHDYMNQAIKLASQWCEQRQIQWHAN